MITEYHHVINLFIYYCTHASVCGEVIAVRNQISTAGDIVVIPALTRAAAASKRGIVGRCEENEYS